MATYLDPHDPTCYHTVVGMSDECRQTEHERQHMVQPTRPNLWATDTVQYAALMPSVKVLRRTAA
jgi:hypothetical protein